MQHKLLAVVARATNYRDHDRILTLITRERGRLTATARGCRKPQSKLLSCTQPFCYGEYELQERDGRFYVRGCDIHEIFYDLRLDPKALKMCIRDRRNRQIRLARTRRADAVVALKNKEVQRIVLTRPAVEAGERLGFLPGDLQQKVDPYLRPLYDALQEFLGYETFLKLQEKGVIEVAPLAYMRGRTLSESYIILDEAQNCTKEQMKMFLTRFGEGSKIVVTGDVTQIDLPHDRVSGLMHAARILSDVEGVSIQYLNQRDVVRHEIVQNIIRAYERAEKKEAAHGRKDASRVRED